MINRTPPCHSRAGGNPSARQVRGWIPVSTGMTLACPNLRGDGYMFIYAHLFRTHGLKGIKG